MDRNHIFTQRIWKAPAVRKLRHAVSLPRIYRHLTASRRDLPGFIIAGAGKSGTTSLFQYLVEHPQVPRPITKEVCFFNMNFHRGVNWYRAHFPLAAARSRSANQGAWKITGESTPHYLFHPLVPQRVASVVPEVKIIILLRNPVDRAFSHYQLRVKRRIETRSFDQAIETEIGLLAGKHEDIANDSQDYDSPTYNRFAYLGHSLYLDAIRQWEKYFRPDQLLIVESSEFFKQTAEVYQRVLDFLGLPPWNPERFGNRYPGGYKERMSDATRQRLTAYFAPRNAQLYAHLGRRFDWDRTERNFSYQLRSAA